MSQFQSYQVSNLSQLSEEAPAGFRTCRIIFKLSDAQKKAGLPKEESKGCFVPQVTSTAAGAFAAAHPQIVADWIQNLQDQKIRAVWLASKRSPTESDLSFDSLAELYNATASSDRLTVEQIKAALAGEFGLAFVNFLAASRGISLENADNVAMLNQVKNNYLVYFAFATARKPAFETAAIKEKVVSVLCAFGDYMVANQIEAGAAIMERCLEKLIDAPVKSVDLTAL